MTTTDTTSTNDDGQGGAPVGATSETLSPLESMERRLADAFDDEGAGRESDDDDGVDWDNLTYRDGKRLEKELKADRERWRPVRDVFDGLNENDAAVILQTVAKMRQDPAAAAADFAKMAQVLGWSPEQTAAAADAVDQATGEQDDPNRPLTVAEYQALEAERAAAAATERTVAQMRAQITDLGYDLDADEGSAEQARAAALIGLASSLDGDIAQAHQRMQELEQQAIDRYIAGKRADAARPGTVGTQGTGPSSERKVETTADAYQAMNSRLDAAFGPEKRR